jgi:hypothetical protein
LHFAPHAMHILISPHTYAFARLRFHGARAGVGDPKGSMVVYKRQMLWILTLLLSRQVPVHPTINPWPFFLILLYVYLN